MQRIDLSRVLGAREGRLLFFDDGAIMAVIDWELEQFDEDWERPGNDAAICNALDALLPEDWSYGGGRAVSWPEMGCVREEILITKEVQHGESD